MNIYEKMTTYLLFIIPLVVVAYIWVWVGPVGFWQMLAMIIVSIFLYIIFLIAFIILIAILLEVK